MCFRHQLIILQQKATFCEQFGEIGRSKKDVTFKGGDEVVRVSRNFNVHVALITCGLLSFNVFQSAIS